MSFQKPIKHLLSISGAILIIAIFFALPASAQECVTMSKLMSYIAEWKTGTGGITMPILMQKISGWKSGANCGNENFVFTFSNQYIDGSGSNLAAIDGMMATGMTHAGVYFRPSAVNAEQDLQYLRGKGYKIAFGQSTGAYSWGSSLPEIQYGNDDSKFLNAPCLNTSLCENWNNNERSIDPSYNGFLWQNSLENLVNVIARAQPEIVLIDNELWSDPYSVQRYFTDRDPGLNCDCKIIEQGIGFDAYYSNWRQKGIGIKNTVKQQSPNATVFFYSEIPVNGTRRYPSWNGSYNPQSIGYFPSGTGDFASPSMYFVPNLDIFEKNLDPLQGMDLQGSVPWLSFTYQYGYSDYGAGAIFFDPSVSREVGRMLRKAGARGFSIYPNANDVKTYFGGTGYAYWLEHAKQLIAGFKEGLDYAEQNKIANADFESFKTIEEAIYNPNSVQFSPVFWQWSDTQASYINTKQFANLEQDKVSGAYSWKHHRGGIAGSRTIFSREFSINSGAQGVYELKAWAKASLSASSSSARYSVQNTATGAETVFGTANFSNAWNQFTGQASLGASTYKLKILIQDNSTQTIDFFLDNFSLLKK